MKHTERNHPHERGQRLLVWLLLLVVLGVIITVRIRLLSVPLERDEGEFAYASQLLLQGSLPFDSVYNMKMPGIYAGYAAILAIFGNSATAIHLGLMMINLASMVLMYRLGRMISGGLAGVCAAACFGFLSLDSSVQGVFAHATHFVVLFALAGILATLKGGDGLRKKWLFAGGLLLGTGFMMKQHGAAFILFSCVILLMQLVANRDAGGFSKTQAFAVFSVGTVMPFLLTCIVLYQAGLFERFWFWTVSYASHYVRMVPFQTGLSHLWYNLSEVFRASEIFWIFAAVGGLFSIQQYRKEKRIPIPLWFAAFSAVSILPGFHFRPHYFILLLPAVSLLAGTGVAGLCRMSERFFVGSNPEGHVVNHTGEDQKNIVKHWPVLALKGYAPILLLFLALVLSMVRNDDYYFTDSPEIVSYRTYPSQFFPDALKISDYIRNHSTGNDTIAVLGSEPQIYFYANRRSATRYIYMYPLMEIHDHALKMQQQMAKEIENARPRFIIFFSSQPSWVVRPGSERWIFAWLKRYTAAYRPVGVADFISPGHVNYVWGEKAAGYRPVSAIWCMIFKRSR